MRAAIVTGAGRAMTAGMQLQFLLGLPADGARAFITSLHEAIEAVHEAPFPIVAMVNGGKTNIMPAHAQRLSAEQIRVLAAYVWSLSNTTTP